MQDVIQKFYGTIERLSTDEEYAKEVFIGKKGNPITLGPAVLTPEEWTEKQVKNASAAADEWLKRVKRPRKEPIKAALEKKEKYKNKMEESLKEERWAKAMEQVDEKVMYEVIDKVGASGYRNGVENKKAKVAAKVKKLQPLVVAVKETIDEMPDATDADREKRLLAARKLMIEVGKIMKGVKTGTPTLK